MINRQWRWLIALTCMVLSTSTRAAPEADLWDFWLPGEVTATAPIDHGSWQQLLDRYLTAAEDQIARFAYRRVTEADRQQLADYLAALADIDPRYYEPVEQMAYWINLYNALTVKVVLDNPDKGSITRMGQGLFSFGPWNDEVIEVAGESLTLNDIEHRILRPIWRDHRIHYAVNCASLGCPDLLETAFTGANLETLLSEAEQRYINHWRGVQFVGDGRLVVSGIFDWYLEDFAADEAALLSYLAAHHQRFSAQLVSYSGRIRYEYDWSLNGVSESAEIGPGDSDSADTGPGASDATEWDDAADDWYQES